MRSMLFTSLMAVLFAGSVIAQDATPAAQQPAPLDLAGLLTADSVEGAEIRSFRPSQDMSFWDTGGEFDIMAAEWESIGNVEDVILDRNGAVVGITTDVGGFLGIGRRPVLLLLEDIRLIATDDDDLVVITRLSEERLEELEELTGVFGFD